MKTRQDLREWSAVAWMEEDSLALKLSIAQSEIHSNKLNALNDYRPAEQVQVVQVVRPRKKPRVRDQIRPRSLDVLSLERASE